MLKYLKISILVLVLSDIAFCQTLDENEYLDSVAFASFERDSFEIAEQTAHEILSKNKLDTNIYNVNANTLLGILNKNRGYYISSTEHYLAALNEAILLNDSARQSVILNNLGTLYKLQENYPKALEYFNKSLDLELNLKDVNNSQLSIRYYNLADTYLEMDSLDLALSYFNNSLLIEQKINDPAGIVYAYLGIANVYLKMENTYDSSLMLQKVKNYAPFENSELKVLFEFSVSKLKFLEGDHIQSLARLQGAVKIVRENKMEFMLLDLMKLELDILRARGEWELLASKYEQYLNRKSELNNQQIKNKIDDLNYQNSLKLKQLEVEALKYEKKQVLEDKQMEQKVNEFTERLLFYLLLLLITAVIFVFIGVRKLNKTQGG